MRLLVMGAGYVGMTLLGRLQNGSYEVGITTTKKEKVAQLLLYGKEVILIDANQGQDEDKAFRELIDRYDAVAIFVAPGKTQSYEEVYLDTANRVFSALKERKRPFYLLYTGSTSVCKGVDAKDAEDDWVTEEMPLFPLSKNETLLLKTEQVYLKCNARVCILRLGGIYGPGRELSARARQLSGKTMAATGNEPTNNIHLDDILAGIIFCLEQKLVGIYHLVNDDHQTRHTVYSTLCQAMDLPDPVWNPEPLEVNGGGYRVSNQKIKQAGFQFQHPLLDLRVK